MVVVLGLERSVPPTGLDGGRTNDGARTAPSPGTESDAGAPGAPTASPPAAPLPPRAPARSAVLAALALASTSDAGGPRPPLDPPGDPATPTPPRPRPPPRPPRRSNPREGRGRESGLPREGISRRRRGFRSPRLIPCPALGEPDSLGDLRSRRGARSDSRTEGKGGGKAALSTSLFRAPDLGTFPVRGVGTQCPGTDKGRGSRRFETLKDSTRSLKTRRDYETGGRGWGSLEGDVVSGGRKEGFSPDLGWGEGTEVE